jgi:hypothetical protein
MSAMPFKANAKCRHHIPKQKRRVTNWPAHEASLRQRGDLTVWFSAEAIASWRAEPRTNRGGQSWYSPLAILTALTLRTVFRLALRQTEGLIGSIMRLLGLDLPVPDHTTLSRRADGLVMPPLPHGLGHSQSSAGATGMHRIVDSTGLQFRGLGEWLVEKHGSKRRRSRRKLHIGLDADIGEIVASELTWNDVDDGSQVGPLLEQIAGPIASFTGDSAYDTTDVYATVAARQAEAAVIVPPRSTAVASETAETDPTPRDRHLACRHRPLQAGHRRRIAFAERCPTGHRGGGRHPCSQAHARFRTPAIRPRYVTVTAMGDLPSSLPLYAPRSPPPTPIASLACRASKASTYLSATQAC